MPRDDRKPAGMGGKRPTSAAKGSTAKKATAKTPTAKKPTAKKTAAATKKR